MEELKFKGKKEKIPLLVTDRQRIRKHWGKTESEVLEILDDIKEWINTQEFPEMPTDSMLEFFLTNCKYNVEKTKANISSYYCIRKQVPIIYRNSNPRLPEMQESWKMGVYCPLPHLTESLYRISIIKLYPDTSIFNVAKHFANILNIYEIRICEDLFLSEIVVVDYKELKWGHVLQFSPFAIHKITQVMEKVAKSRIKQIHIVDAPYFVNILVNIGKKILKKKIGDRIQVHKTYETLYEYVPQESLPIDYGGKERSLDELVALWKKQVEVYQDRFDMLEKLDLEEVEE